MAFFITQLCIIMLHNCVLLFCNIQYFYMKRFIAVLSGVFAGLCLFVTPTLASRTQLTVNIPDGHNAQVTNQSIKIDSENDGSVTFTGKAEKDAVITIEKHNGNKHHYKVKPDDNGNLPKR